MEFTPQAKRAFHMQSYGPGPSIDGIELVELKRFADDAGTLTELARLSDGRAAAFAGFALRQINYSELSPGAIKAFHLHTRQTDIWYVPPGDRVLVVLVDVPRARRRRACARGSCSVTVRRDCCASRRGWPTACGISARRRDGSSTSPTFISRPSPRRATRGGCRGTTRAPTYGT